MLLSFISFLPIEDLKRACYGFFLGGPPCRSSQCISAAVAPSCATCMPFSAQHCSWGSGWLLVAAHFPWNSEAEDRNVPLLQDVTARVVGCVWVEVSGKVEEKRPNGWEYFPNIGSLLRGATLHDATMFHLRNASRCVKVGKGPKAMPRCPCWCQVLWGGW